MPQGGFMRAPSLVTFNQTKRLKVAYIVKRFPRLSDAFILNELLELESLGVEVEVFSMNPPEQDVRHRLIEKLNAPVFYLPGKDFSSTVQVKSINYCSDTDDLVTLKQLTKSTKDISSPFPGKRQSQYVSLQIQAGILSGLLLMRGITHMHAHFASDATTLAMLASRISGIRYSFTAHARDIYHTCSRPQLDKAFLITKLIESSFTVTVSDYNQAYLKRLTNDRGDIKRLYKGVNLERLKFYTGDREKTTILAVGRMVDRKGFEYLIQACSRLKSQNIPFICKIIGDGPCRLRLEKMIQALGVDDVVKLCGSMTYGEVLQAMRTATVFALPCVISKTGDRDGLPAVLLESMAIGLPVISTRITGIPEIIDDGKSGWLVDPEDSLALSVTLQDILLMTNSERREIAVNARVKAERQFSLKTNVQVLNRLFWTYGSNQRYVLAGGAL